MMCQHLFNSLFLSSLPFGGMTTKQNLAPRDLAAWGKALSNSLEPYEDLFAKRIDAKRVFIEMINEKLVGMELYDRQAMEAQYAELQVAYAAIELEREEKRQRGEPERPILVENADIRDRIVDFLEDVSQRCPSLENDQQVETHRMLVSGYAVFESLLIQHDRMPQFGKVLFTYELDSKKLFDFFMAPAFPVSPQEVTETLIFKDIVDFKTYIVGYAEIIDILVAEFSGKQYIYIDISQLVEYYLDVLGYAYVVNYKTFLATFDADLIVKIENFPSLFEFHFLNFLSNIEHTRCAIHAFLNKDTMKTLSAIVGQYNTLERHKKRAARISSKEDTFAAMLRKTWENTPELQDHTELLAHVQASKSKKIQELYQLFGLAKTRHIIVSVLQDYNAVRGMAGFTKRQVASGAKAAKARLRNRDNQG